MKIAFTVILFIGTTLIGLAQIDANRFNSHFSEDEEMHEVKRTNHSGLYQFEQSQALPNWFVRPPVSENNSMYSIGISDPEMDSVAAIQLAVDRALMMANVFNYSLTQLLCNFFMDEGEHASNVVYENYAQILSYQPYHRDSIELVQFTYNAFNEAIVLIKYPVYSYESSNLTQNIVLDVYKNEVESSVYGDYESIYEFSVGDEKDSSYWQYQLTELGPRYNVTGVIDTNNYELPIYTLKYHLGNRTDSTAVAFFTHGLWKEYFKSVCNDVVANARKKPENINVLADKYQTDSYQKMTQGISKNEQRFTIHKIGIENNTLQVGLLEMELLDK